jgi:hypothetical protein
VWLSCCILAATSLNEKAPTLNKESRVVFLSMASLILTAAVWALPGTATRSSAQPNAMHEQAGTQTQSISGKIASVGKSSFTLTITSQGLSELGTSSQEAASKSMTSVIDKNTTVDGKLQVSANAGVIYKEDHGKKCCY